MDLEGKSSWWMQFYARFRTVNCSHSIGSLSVLSNNYRILRQLHQRQSQRLKRTVELQTHNLVLSHWNSENSETNFAVPEAVVVAPRAARSGAHGQREGEAPRGALRPSCRRDAPHRLVRDRRKRHAPRRVETHRQAARPHLLRVLHCRHGTVFDFGVSQIALLLLKSRFCRFTRRLAISMALLWRCFINLSTRIPGVRCAVIVQPQDECVFSCVNVLRHRSRLWNEWKNCVGILWQLYQNVWKDGRKFPNAVDCGQ